MDSITWQHLPRSLRFLRLDNLTELEELPEGMQYCTSLTSLIIWICPKLQFIPNWMSKFTSLQKLQLRYCSVRLVERCQNPNGEDWALIQHIPLLRILDSKCERELGKTGDTERWVYEDDWAS